MMNLARMNYVLRTLVTIVIIFALVPDTVHARPARGIISRQKRVSDQRIAELETRVALEGSQGKMVIVPLAFGRVDPAKIGRRRRSSMEYNLRKLRRILQEVARDSLPVRKENDEMLSYSWQSEDNRDDDAETQLI